ncbi:MAG: response regulator [Blastocatellia bacterium]|nr:response regulator [Blastocatellia bacterium]MCS7158397.1 response regulator [Blastocatellia bacterium]MCX7752903.1 response regulator [Blastocatellia bacterium]MDW8167959.1 response regulator [Acidobacteriota bacterium]MDW8255984.1 response regulator [Acidobacteriota bacterium]
MKPIVILLVEDNPDHVLLIKRALELNNILNEVHVVEDGQEALDYLYRQGKYADPDSAPRPGLILLDIKLPKVDGLEVLRRIKSDPILKAIPIIMLTSSEQEADILRSYLNGANSYIVKPIQFDAFVQKVRELKLYWILVNTLPPESALWGATP